MQDERLLVLAIYRTGERWGWETILVRPGGWVLERHDAGARYSGHLTAQQAGVDFCQRYWQRLPDVVRVNGVTLKGRRHDTGDL